MANICSFDMRITGKEEAIKEFASMLRWEGKFEHAGLGRVYDFEPDIAELEETAVPGIYTVTGYGSCAWSVLTAMCEEYRKDAPSLESETERLGLVVEIYSSEPGCCFQEHYLIAKGDVITDECVDYEEHWIGSSSLLEEYNKQYGTAFTPDMLNEDGNIAIGGFGEQFGEYEDVTRFFSEERLMPSLSSQIQTANGNANDTPNEIIRDTVEQER